MKTPIAYFIGYQLTLKGERVALFNLIARLPMAGESGLFHPIESTVSAHTLRANGVFIPLEMVRGEVVTIGAQQIGAPCLTCGVI
jgi:hypothetical protein